MEMESGTWAEDGEEEEEEGIVEQSDSAQHLADGSLGFVFAVVVFS